MTNPIHKTSLHWTELDVMRGLAAFLMVVNHLGYKTLAPNLIKSSLLGNLIFVGSLAPVLFFFVTGVGYGIQSSRKKKPNYWYATLNKVLILIFADLIMYWSQGKWLGLDFLAFIGLSSLVLEVVRNSKSPIASCIAGLVAVSLMRYLIGPVIHSFGYDYLAGGLIRFIFGTATTPGVSYPLSPWLAYPFAGYLVGVAATRYKRFIESHRWRVIIGLLLLAGVPAGAGIIMSRAGSSFNRWGNVALGFYIVSFAVILMALAGVLAISSSPKLERSQNAIALKGISSLAVVPVHYFLIYCLVSAGITGLGSVNFGLLTIAVVILSFLLARLVESLSHVLQRRQNQRVLWFSLVGMFLLLASVTLIYSGQSLSFAMITRTLAQLALCLLFVVRLPQH